MIGRRGVLAAPLMLAAVPARAQPADPLRIVANFPPGASVDGVARLLADHAMRSGRGTSVVENRVGAGGNLGAASVARARPDGRTLLVTLDTVLSVNPHLYRDAGFDAATAFAPVALLGTFPLALLVHPSAPYADLRGFLDAARRSPIFYTSAGVGSPGHLAMEHLRQIAGLPASGLEHVPLRGNAEALTALVSGTVTAGFLSISGGPDLVRSGRLRALATSGAARATVLPEVPTVGESGHPGFEVRFATLLLAPRGTPDGAVADWAALAEAALATETGRARLAGWGLDPVIGGPAAAEAFLAGARERWSRVVREAGMRAE